MVEGVERKHKARHTASVLLIVLVAVLMPLVVTAGWAVTTVTNTDRFVSTMSAVGTNPTVTSYLAAEGAATIVVDLHVEQRIADKLPSTAKFIAPLITTQIQQQLTKLLSTVLASPKFQNLWTAQLRLLHGAFVKAMTTNESKVSQAANLALNVTPQLLAAIDALDARNIHVLDPARKYLAGDKHLLVTLAQGKEFHQVQEYFHLVTMLRWVLWVATLVLAAAAVLVDARRRRGGLWLGIAVACSSVVMLALLAVGKQYAMSHSPTPPDVTNVVFSTLTSYLRWELRAIIVIGLLAALVLWFTGPSRQARGLRGMFARGGGKAAAAVGAIGSREGEGSTVADWVARHATALGWLGVVVGGIILVVWVDSLIGALVTVLLVAAWFVAMVAIRRRVDAARNVAAVGSTTTEPPPARP